MKTIKVAEATELQLDWLVARIEGDELPKAGGKGLDYSTDWACGGPLLGREGISVIFHEQGHWTASNLHGTVCVGGPTPLIAAMRCFCCSKLGDVVDIPEELCQQQNS